jgi:hypothetical protein
MSRTSRAPRWILALALPACTSRPVDEGTAGTTTAGTTTTTGLPVTSGPGTTSPGPTDPGTTTPGTTAPGTTTTDDTSTPEDLPPQPVTVPPGLWGGCTTAAPEGTKIIGEGSLGPFNGTRAFFGIFEVSGQLGEPRLLILDDSADVDLALAEFAESSDTIVTGPGALLVPYLQFTAETPYWEDTAEMAVLTFIVGGEAESIQVVVRINDHGGVWDAQDPDDPPRLLGQIEPGGGLPQFSGKFHAVFCDTLSAHFMFE